MIARPRMSQNERKSTEIRASKVGQCLTLFLPRWNGGPREGRGAEALEKGGQIAGAGGAGGGWDSIFENDQSDKVLDAEKAAALWKYSTIVTGSDWPEANQPKSPCPTLKVIGAVTDFMNAKEEAKRLKEEPGMVAGKGIVVTAVVAKAADTVLDRAGKARQAGQLQRLLARSFSTHFG